MLLVGIVALSVAVPLLILGTWGSTRRRKREQDALGYVQSLGLIASPRAGAASSRLGALAARVTPVARLERMRARLENIPGAPTLDAFLARKALGAVAGLAVGLFAVAAGRGALLLLLAPPAGWLTPNVLLQRMHARRGEQIRAALPESLDLMAISVEAGVGLEGALARAATDVGGSLGEEFRRTLDEMALGASRREALQSLKRRSSVPELSSFVVALLQADALGMAVGRVLKTQAGEMRLKRRQRAREQAAKAPVKIVFPLVFGIFPALLIVILGPAVLQIKDTLVGP